MLPVTVTNLLTIHDNEMRLSACLVARHHCEGYMTNLVCSMNVSQKAEGKDESICGPSIPFYDMVSLTQVIFLLPVHR